jgi:hypothetical protein
MTEQRFSVVCTDGGRHGRIDWGEVILADDDTIRQERTRQAPLATGRRRKAVVRREDHRSDRGTWRWKCPRCGIDVPLSDDHLRAWMKATPGLVLDISVISQLPR